MSDPAIKVGDELLSIWCPEDVAADRLVELHCKVLTATRVVDAGLGITEYVNPDGPPAAAYIQSLAAQVARYEAARAEIEALCVLSSEAVDLIDRDDVIAILDRASGTGEESDSGKHIVASGTGEAVND